VLVYDETHRGVYWISWRTFWANIINVLFQIKCFWTYVDVEIFFQIKCFWTHIDVDIFSVLVSGSCAQSLSTPFSYTLYATYRCVTHINPSWWSEV
jgi:hypothetical protein